jgi:hypothetical protein
MPGIGCRVLPCVRRTRRTSAFQSPLLPPARGIRTGQKQELYCHDTFRGGGSATLPARDARRPTCTARRPSSAAATAGGRRGEAIGGEKHVGDRGFRPPRARPPRDAMTMPERPALGAPAPARARGPSALTAIPPLDVASGALRARTGAARSPGARLALRAARCRRPIPAPANRRKAPSACGPEKPNFRVSDDPPSVPRLRGLTSNYESETPIPPRLLT